MLIRRAILEDFGPYRGSNEFDLAPRVRYGRKRPAILFGGKNGTGKTTLLEAIRLALYGKGALGPRVSQRKYHAFLKKRIHRRKDSPLLLNQAAVAIEFDYVLRGERSTYLVERTWALRNGNGVDEQLTLLQNGKPLTEVDPEHWDSFVQDIVPERLSQLFFFDGEKIKSIAEDDTSADALAESVKSLLGLDLAERLRADLSLYSARVTRKEATGDRKQERLQVDTDIKRTAAEHSLRREKLAETETKIDGVEREIEKAEKYLRSQGHAYAEKREELKANESAMSAKIEELEKQLREECEGLFPLALCPTVAESLLEQLASEKALKKWGSAREELKCVKRKISRMITAEQKRGTKTAREALAKAKKIVNAAIGEREDRPASLGDVEPVHELSDVDTDRIRGWFDGATRSSTRVGKLARQLETAHRTARKVRVDLSRAPEDDAIGPYVVELAELNRRLGVLQQQRDECQQEIASLDREQKMLERQRSKLIEQQEVRQGLQTRLAHARNAQAGLSTYLERLTSAKVAMLRQAVAECYNRLCRKRDMLREIDIDPRTFAITLFDQKHRAVPREDLSEGEKQIFAISLLWGLARTSGRPLPVIIDTPLARLDSDHRRNLITNYYPHASHQMIILSTDTEVDEKLFEDLGPHLSHCYHLEFDDDAGCTRPEEGYFWKESARA